MRQVSQYTFALPSGALSVIRRFALIAALAVCLVGASFKPAEAATAYEVQQRSQMAAYTGYGSVIAGGVLGIIGFMVFTGCTQGDCTDSTLRTSAFFMTGGATVAYLGVHLLAAGNFWQSRALVRRRYQVTRADGQIALGLGIVSLLTGALTWYYFSIDSQGTRFTLPISALALVGTAWFGHRQHMVNGNWFIPGPRRELQRSGGGGVGSAPTPSPSWIVAPYVMDGGGGLAFSGVF